MARPLPAPRHSARDADRSRVGVLQGRSFEIQFVGTRRQVVRRGVQGAGAGAGHGGETGDVQRADLADTLVSRPGDSGRDIAPARHDRSHSDLRVSGGMDRSSALGIHAGLPADARARRVVARPSDRASVREEVVSSTGSTIAFHQRLIPTWLRGIQDSSEGIAVTSKQLDELCINTIRTLSMDAVQQANSGHPGTAMAMAPVVYSLWQRHMRFDPEDPIWPNRDRFVLSIGHASMLLYSVLHLAGVKAVNPKYERIGGPTVTLDDIKRFRQLESKCPGHPEYRWTSGVETTTGPLGQGVATSVGMAMAARWMAPRFNRPDFELFDYDVYALCGDGCMMEGVSSEAASLAVHLRLANLCWIYHNNKITIEGHTDWAFSEDVATRFMAYGWNVTRVGDANDLEMLDRAFRTFKSTSDRPTLIIVDSHIAYGSPNKQDTSAAHREPLGAQECRLTNRAYGWPEDATFLVPEEAPQHFRDGIGRRGHELRSQWMARFHEYGTRYPDLADELSRMQRRHLPEQWDRDLPLFPPDPQGMAGRDASSAVLNVLAKNVPWLGGGAADLAPSTKTRLTFAGAGDFTANDYGGRNLHFGIREHAMGSILNGLSLSKVRAYGSGFLIFSDYSRPAIRLGAIMELPVIYIFTHDSIGVGEDGPTHQPIEQLASLRAIPGLITLRPGDAN